MFWSRVFAAAAERGDGLLDLMLHYAVEGPFLIAWETRKDAIDVVVKGYDRMNVAERESFERRVLSLDFARFGDRRATARLDCLEKLFGAIGSARLATEEARGGVDPGRRGGQPGEGERATVGSRERLRRVGTRRSSGDGSKPTWSVLKVCGGDSGCRDGGGLRRRRAAAVRFVRRRMRAPGRGGKEHRRHGRGRRTRAQGRGCHRRRMPGDLQGRYASAGGRVFAHRALRSPTPGRRRRREVRRWTRRPRRGAADLLSCELPAARVEAAEAVLRTLGARPDLRPRLSGDLEGLLADAHPVVRMRAGVNLGRIGDSDPTGFRERLRSRVRCESNAAVLRFMSNTVLRQTMGLDAAFAESLVLELLGRWTGESDTAQRLRTSLAANLTLLGIRHRREESLAVIEGWIGDCADYHQELGRVLETMREGYTLGLREDGTDRNAALRHRCQGLALRIAKAAAADFIARAELVERTDAEAALARQSAQLLDVVCGEIHMSATGGQNGDGSRKAPELGLATFLDEASPILMCLAGAGTPHTVYRLLELLEYLLPLDPGKAFDIAMHAALGGGRRSGFHFEPMGADRLVGIVGCVLADYRELFEVEKRRQTLVECLELFASAGWPSASRLLYRLPGLFR